MFFPRRISYLPLVLAACSCVDVSYKTLCDSEEAYYNRVLYTEMEMFIPAGK